MNICKNMITIIGLQEAPEHFVKALSKAMFDVDLDNLDPAKWGEVATVDGAMWYGSLVDEYRREGSYAARYCILYPGEPYDNLGVRLPRFYVESKWKTPLEEVRAASKLYPSLTFDVCWWVLQDGPSGEFVLRNGQLLEATERLASGYLFDSILHPSIGLLSAHLPLTLTQHATARLQDAISLVRGLIGVLEDERFVNSPYTPYSDVRDQDKTAKVHARLTALLETMTHQVANIDFTNVLLEREDLPAAYARSLESTRQLMTDLGLDPLLPAEGNTPRFAILPPPVAIVSDPYRVIVPTVCYRNANPVSAKYDRNCLDADGFAIEWEIRYACLTRFDLTQIHRLPEHDETPGDIDIIMVRAGEHSIGHQFHRASKARWQQNPEIAQAVEKAAREASSVFAAALADKPGVAIFEDFKAAQSSSHESV